MKTTLRLFILACLLFLLLAFTACDSQPLAAYNDAATKTVMETSYRQSWSARAVATFSDYSKVEVTVKEDIACTGNTGATYQVSGRGSEGMYASYSNERLEIPYNLYVRDGYTHYQYPGYYEDGSDDKYKVPLGYEGDEAIRDMLTVYLVDIESASTEVNENGQIVITMEMKPKEIEYYMGWAIEMLDWMMFGDGELPDLTLKSMTLITLLDGEGRILQSTATVMGTGLYQDSYLTMVYMYDLNYSDYGAEIVHDFPADLGSYPVAE